MTSDPCPRAVNPDNGCIHLGMLVDASPGPYGDRARRVARAQVAFWAQVNRDGGIAGHDIDVDGFVRDTGGGPDDRAAYGAIRDDVVALAHVSGPDTVAMLLDDLRTDRMVAVPTVTVSDWLFTDEVAETGSSACVEA